MKQQQAKWKNRIVDDAELPPLQVVPNDRNWRTHPKAQQEATQAVLNEVGWVQRLIVNTTTGNLIDGHLRLKLAIENNEPLVPVVYVELSEKEEKKVLATYDLLSGMAETDDLALDSLLSEIETGEKALQSLVDDYLAQSPLNELEEEEEVNEELEELGENLEDISDKFEGLFQLRSDVTFASEDPFHIPPLREDMLLSLPPEDLETWAGDDLREKVSKNGNYWLQYSTSCRTIDFSRTILHFYTDDYRFDPFWKKAEQWVTKFLKAGLKGVVTPNFTIHPKQPMAISIWRMYQKNWLGRYMQEAGIKVIPDVIYRTMSDADLNLTFSGIPIGAPCVSLQLQNLDKKLDYYEEWEKDHLSAVMNRLKPKGLIVYTGKPGRAIVESMGLKIPVRFVPTLLNLRSAHLATKKGKLK